MNHSSEGNRGRDDGGSTPAPHSARVRLEVAFLDADETPPAPAPLSTHDERPQLTMLVVASESDVRHYVRECVVRLAGVRVLEAATAAAGVAVAASHALDLGIIDESEMAGLAALADLSTIVLVDEIPHGAPPVPRRRLLARPFSAADLIAEIGKLMAQDIVVRHPPAP